MRCVTQHAISSIGVFLITRTYCTTFNILCYILSWLCSVSVRIFRILSKSNMNIYWERDSFPFLCLSNERIYSVFLHHRHCHATHPKLNYLNVYSSALTFRFFLHICIMNSVSFRFLHSFSPFKDMFNLALAPCSYIIKIGECSR